jgi:hypothetical protein
MQLVPSESNSSGYNLTLSDNSEEYSYNGTRTSGDGQYVLIFDPIKKHFVLHQVDSTFDMNLVSAPWEDDASTLQSLYPQLQPPPPAVAQTETPQRKTAKGAKNAPVPKSEPKRRKAVEKPKAAEKPKKPNPPPREPTPEEEESDDGLTIEYPDAPSNSQPYQHRSTPTFKTDITEEISDEDADAEGEEYDEEMNQDVDHLKLPSPANNAGGLSDEELELDLEAELENALMETTGTGANESDESEEE